MNMVSSRCVDCCCASYRTPICVPNTDDTPLLVQCQIFDWLVQGFHLTSATIVLELTLFTSCRIPRQTSCNRRYDYKHGEDSLQSQHILIGQDLLVRPYHIQSPLCSFLQHADHTLITQIYTRVTNAIQHGTHFETLANHCTFVVFTGRGAANEEKNGRLHRALSLYCSPFKACSRPIPLKTSLAMKIPHPRKILH